VTAEETASGHTQIKDETPGSEKLVDIHRTGTYTAIFPDGSQENKIIGRNVVIVEKDNHVTITGSCSVTIHGNSEITVDGNKTERIKGNYILEVDGDFTKTVIGDDSTSVGGDTTLISSPTGLGTYRILTNGTGTVNINGSLYLGGEVQAASITSRSMVTAGTGILAGVSDPTRPGSEFAGIRTLGGITAGAPTPSEPGSITATLDVKAPLVVGVQVFDVRGSMEIIRDMYDAHIHPTPKGPSGPPIPLM
jgi:hypothetical protein